MGEYFDDISFDSEAKSRTDAKFGSSITYKKLNLGINHGNDLVSGFLVVGLVGAVLYYFTNTKKGKGFVPINKRKAKGK